MTGLVWTSAIAQEPPPYQVIAADGTRPLPVARRSGTTDFVTLEALRAFFNITMREDPRADGIVIAAGTQRVVLTAGQATVSAGGRLVSLSAPVTKDGSRWLVPIDFLRVLDPVLNRRIEIRREARLIVLDARRGAADSSRASSAHPAEAGSALPWIRRCPPACRAPAIW